MSDPKGPEPTPLTARRRSEAHTTFVVALADAQIRLRRRMSMAVDEAQELHNEIEGYRQALEKLRDDIASGVVERPKGDRPRRYHALWPEEEGHEGMCGYCWQPPEEHVIVEIDSVLAGKEAQG